MELWKTTIEIMTDYDPKELNLVVLAREAESGDALCLSQKTTEVDPSEYGDEVLGFFSTFEGDEDDS